MIIAIDGPAGAGKSTVAREVARRLGYTYIDTGAMYRAVALCALRTGCSPDDAEAVSQLAEAYDIRLEPAAGGAGSVRVFLNGEEVTDAIRAPEVTAQVSAVAAHAGVRRRLVDLQRAMAEGGRVVMDGRDIGTVVLPHADLKIFLDASPEERAKRRFNELRSKGFEVSLNEVSTALAARDQKDSSRGIAPLRPAEDAVRIDTTQKEAAAVVDEIIELSSRALRQTGGSPHRRR